MNILTNDVETQKHMTTVFFGYTRSRAADQE